MQANITNAVIWLSTSLIDVLISPLPAGRNHNIEVIHALVNSNHES